MTPQTPQHTPVEETLRRLIYEKYIAPTERPKRPVPVSNSNCPS